MMKHQKNHACKYNSYSDKCVKSEIFEEDDKDFMIDFNVIFVTTYGGNNTKGNSKVKFKSEIILQT